MSALIACEPPQPDYVHPTEDGWLMRVFAFSPALFFSPMLTGGLLGGGMGASITLMAVIGAGGAWHIGLLLLTLSAIVTYFGLLALGVEDYNYPSFKNGMGVKLVDMRAERRQQRRERRWHKQLAALDVQEGGWRPRQGARHPAGREDTYPRLRVEAQASSRGVELMLREWTCDGDRRWHRGMVVEHTRQMFTDADKNPDALMDYRLRLERTAKLIEAERGGPAVDDDVLLAMNRAIAEKINAAA